MEVISKELHKNLLPILFIVFVMFSIIAAMSTTSGIILAKALVTQVTHVEAGKNGLAHFSISEEQPTLGNDVQQSGGQAAQSIRLQSSAYYLDQ